MWPIVLLSGATALSVLLLVIGLYVWFNRQRLARARDLRERLGSLEELRERATESVAILKEAPVSTSVLDALLARSRFAPYLTALAARTGVEWSVGEVLGYVLLGGMAGVLASFVVQPLMSLAVGIAGVVAPFLVVRRRRAQREKAIEEQLPEAVDMLVNSLRAGYSLQAAMSFVGNELPAPLGPEFTRFHDEQRLGVDTRQALDNLQRRLSTLDARMFVLALLIQRETGGNLSEILGNISTVVRERINFRAQVGVMTAESKLSAVVLSAIPLGMYGVIRFMSPEYATELTETSFGRSLLMYGAVSLTIGFLWLRKIARIEV
jgi:tight adherence protein B